MSRHVRLRFAEARAAIEDLGVVAYGNLVRRSPEGQRAMARWTMAERRMDRAARCGRRHRAQHYSRQASRWWMRTERALAVTHWGGRRLS